MNPLEALAPHSIWGMMRTYNDFIGFRAKHSRGYIGVLAAIFGSRQRDDFFSTPANGARERAAMHREIMASCAVARWMGVPAWV
jgi:hypothetical protein